MFPDFDRSDDRPADDRREYYRRESYCRADVSKLITFHLSIKMFVTTVPTERSA